jgi:hypothetical protein
MEFFFLCGRIWIWGVRNKNLKKKNARINFALSICPLSKCNNSRIQNAFSWSLIFVIVTDHTTNSVGDQLQALGCQGWVRERGNAWWDISLGAKIFPSDDEVLSSPSFSPGGSWRLSSPVEQLAQSHGVFWLAVTQEREATLAEWSTTLLHVHLFSIFVSSQAKN